MPVPPVGDAFNALHPLAEPPAAEEAGESRFAGPRLIPRAPLRVRSAAVRAGSGLDASSRSLYAGEPKASTAERYEPMWIMANPESTARLGSTVWREISIAASLARRESLAGSRFSR